MNLTLLNTPAGFDVFIKPDLNPVSNEVPAQAGVTIEPPWRFVLRRQPQFTGSAEVIYAIDGVRQPAMETGINTVRRLDWIASAPGANPPFRIVTISERKPKILQA